jgi:hypothetical protein
MCDLEEGKYALSDNSSCNNSFDSDKVRDN